MKKHNILILSSSNHVQLVNSFKNAIKTLKFKGEVYTADLQRYCASGMVSKEHFEIPRSDSDMYFSALRKIIEEKEISVVLSARDEELYLLSKNKNFFKDLGCFLLISDNESISLCNDKYKLSKFFYENKIPQPDTYLFEDLIEKKIDFPLICKPRSGKGGIGIYKAPNYDFIKQNIEEKDNYLFQEYIVGTEYTIDLLLDFHSNVLSVIPRERVLVKGGESIITITKKNDLLIEYAKKIAETIGFIGHINIQCIIKDQKPYFIEINPRFGGASNSAFRAGMNSPLNIMKMLNGDTIKPFIGQFEENLMMLRYTNDFFLKMEK